MNKKKKFLLILLGIGILLNFNMNKVIAYKVWYGDVDTDAWGEGQTGTGGQHGCKGQDTCYSGRDGAKVTINPVEGSTLEGVELFLKDEDLAKLEWSYPINLDSLTTNLQFAEDWKAAISGIGAIVNGEAEPTKLQEFILDELAAKNNMTKSQFYEAYQKDSATNSKSFEYHATPMAQVCRTGTTDCEYFSDMDACHEKYNDDYGCSMVLKANDACGKVECAGDDKNQIRKEQSCIEQHPDNPEVCYPKPKPPPTTEPETPTIDPDSCSPKEKEPKTFNPPILVEEEPYGSVGCGDSYTTYSYDYGKTSCQYVKTLITTEKTETYPGIYGTYNAGDQLNFSNVVYWHSTTTEVAWDYSELYNEIAKAESIIDSIEEAIKCKEAEITEIDEAIKQYEDAEGDCSSPDAQECLDSCVNDPNAVGEVLDCYDSCMEDDCPDYSSEISELEEKKEEISAEIENLRNSSDYTGAQARLEELNNCEASANSFQSKSSSSSGSYTLSGTYLSIDKYTQPIDSIKGIAKNSGQLLTQNELNSFKQPYLGVNSNFVIPIRTKNGTDGEVVAGGGLYSCPIKVRNLLIADCSKGDCSSGGLNVIYRPISLTNPFPSLNSDKYRAMGANWNETYAETVIKNNRGVSTYDVYNQTPIYTIELTPSKIKEIRKYNKKVPYDNFDMNCTDGYLCSSNFLWGTTANGYNFSDIVVQSESCATSNGWAACYGGAN